jgi:hypothetical protein
MNGWNPAKGVSRTSYNYRIHLKKCSEGCQLFTTLFPVLVSMKLATSTVLCLAVTVWISAVSSQFNLVNCQNSISSSFANGARGIVDRDGNAATSLDDARGYEYSTCLEVCGTGIDSYNATMVASQLTLWFLPSLTLLAQIPFVTASGTGDIMVCLLTLGSPMLALYSLFVSLLNWQWIMKWGVDGDAFMVKTLPDVLGRLQQFPVRVENPSLLVSALHIPENKPWWDDILTRFRARERRLSASAAAQLFLAGGCLSLCSNRGDRKSRRYAFSCRRANFL